MYKLSKSRIFIIIAICLLGIFFTIPNLLPNKDSLPKWWQPVNLGLDLQGGSNLLLQVQVDDVIKERMGTIEDSVRQVLRENKIRYQNLRAGENDVTVKIENINSRNKAMAAFRKIEDGLNVEETADDTVRISYTDLALGQLKRKIVDQSIEIVRRRIDELGTKEPVIQSQGVDRIVVQLPGLQNPEYVKTLLGKTAKLSFHMVDSNTTSADARRGKLSNASRIVPGADGGSYVINRKPVVSGENLIDAQPAFQEGEAVVSFKFDSIGGKKFGEVTKNNIGEKLAIVLDNEVISAPTIQGAILGGSGVITYSWKTDNGDIATVDSNGMVTAKGNGTVTITVTASNGASATCKVTVSAASSSSSGSSSSSSSSSSELDGIVPVEDEISIARGNSKKLAYEVRPAGENPKVSFQSSDTQVATVTDDGVAVGMKPGVATITLTAEDGSSCEWTITVTDSGSIWH